MHPESFQNLSSFQHFVMFQTHLKMYSIHFFPQIYTQYSTMTKQNQVFSRSTRLDGERHFQVSPEMLYWVQVWTLAGPHKDFHRVFLKTLLCFLGGMLQVVVLLKCKPSPQRTMEKVFTQDSSIFFSINLSLYPAKTPSSCCRKASPQHDAATTMFDCMYGINEAMLSAWFPTPTPLGIVAK